VTTQELTTYTSPLNEDMPLAQLGQTLFKSGFFQDTRDASQAIVKILAGREMGIGPIAAMTGINVIKGRVTMSANLIAAQIKRSGRYDYRVARLDDTGCEIVFYERAGGKATELGRSSFTAEDAKAAQLGGENYKKFPRNMYFSRALTNGARWYTPEVFGGSAIYTPDELVIESEPATYAPRSDVNVETGEVIEQAPALDERAQLIIELRGLASQAKGLGLDLGLGKPKDMTDAQLAEAIATARSMINAEYAEIDKAEQPAEVA